MAGLFYGDPTDPASIEAEGVDAMESSTGQVLGAVAMGGLEALPLNRIGRFVAEQNLPTLDDYGRAVDTPQASPILDPDAATQRFGIPGVLSFKAPVSERIAQDQHDAHQRAMQQADVIARRPDNVLTGMVARGAVGLAVGMLDPIYLAAGLVPGIGEARAASLLASAGDAAGLAGRMAVRFGAGAVQGAAGMAALEPLNYALDQAEGNDWQMGDALRNIAFGSILGGGLHVILAHPRAPMTDVIERAGPDARAGALQVGVGQHVTGDPVSVAPVIEAGLLSEPMDQAAQQSAFAARMAARGETEAGNYRVYTAGGITAEVRPEVVEAGDLITSHDDAGNVNPIYPHAEGMQPRDRTSVASQAQITEMASRLEPERLGRNVEAAAGAPIINDTGVVESGNGRVMALRRVHSDPAFADQAAAYRSYLAAAGHDVEGMTAPVLVARRVTKLEPDQARAFAEGANTAPVMSMTAAEQARMDVRRVGVAIGELKPGSITGRQNRDFVGAFMAQVGKEERNQLIGSDGSLAAPGAARIRAAVLAHAYGDALGPALETMLTGDTTQLRSVSGALADVAPVWSQLRAAIAAGQVPAGLDITPALGEAVRFLDQAARTGTTPAAALAQADMFSRPSPPAEALLRALFQDDAMRRPISRDRLAKLLADYADQAMQAKAGGGLFGAAETTPAEVLRLLADDNTRVRAVADALQAAADPRAAEAPADQATSQAATTAAKAGTADHVGEGAEASIPAGWIRDDRFGESASPEGRAMPGQTAEPAPDYTAREILQRSTNDPIWFSAADGQRFLALEPGNPDLATAPRDATATETEELPIRIRRAELRHINDGKHQKDAAILGYDDPLHMLLDVLHHWDTLNQGTNGRLLLVRHGAANATAVVELTKAVDSDYWRVVTVGRRSDIQLGEPLRTRTRPPDAAADQQPLSSLPALDIGEPRRLAQGPSGAKDMGADAPADKTQPGDTEPPGEAAGDTTETPIGADTDTTPLHVRVMSPEIEAAQRLADEAVAAVQTELAAGRLTEADLAPLREAEANLAQAEGTARAYEAAAACLISGVEGAAT